MAMGLFYFLHQKCQILMTFWPVNSGQFKNLRRLLQRIQSVALKYNLALSYVFCDYSMLVTLCKVGEVCFRFLGTNGFSCKGKEWKIYCCGLALPSKHVQSNMKISRRYLAKNCTKKRVARAARLFFPHSTNQIIDLWRCRCRCCRRFLNSLVKVTITG